MAGFQKFSPSQAQKRIPEPREIVTVGVKQRIVLATACSTDGDQEKEDKAVAVAVEQHRCANEAPIMESLGAWEPSRIQNPSQLDQEGISQNCLLIRDKG